MSYYYKGEIVIQLNMLSIPEELIIRNLQNTASEEEMRRLNKWLKEDEKHIELYTQMGEIWSARSNLGQEVIREGWNRLYGEIKRMPSTKEIPLPAKKKLLPLWVRYGAAVFIGALAASALWFNLQSEKAFKQGLMIQNVVYNHNGVQSVHLPDGSEVYVNENTKLTYPGMFTEAQRHVQLEGSAYFSVQKDTEKPFVVSVGAVDVEVTGTEFFIDSTSGNTRSVTLVSGGVDVSCVGEAGRKSAVKLMPGQAANIDLVKGNIEVVETDTDYYVAWKDGIYRFVDEPLEKIAALVAKRLDIEIQIASSLKTKRFTGRITPENDIQDILATIYKSYPIKYQIKGKVVKIND